jgi:hypothetical protein
MQEILIISGKPSNPHTPYPSQLFALSHKESKHTSLMFQGYMSSTGR